MEALAGRLSGKNVSLQSLRSNPLAGSPRSSSTSAPSVSVRAKKKGNTISATLSLTAATAASASAAKDRVDVLAEALPFIQRFQGKTVVVKYGGAAMKDETLKDGVIKDLVLLACVGLRPIFVHGGGPEINSWLARLGIQPQFKNGLRVTDAATMEVVEMVLVGRVNKSLVSLIHQAGGAAVGLSGIDGRVITARASSDPGLGFVGEISAIDTGLIRGIARDGFIPVIASVAADGKGQAYNINADIAAGEIAASLGAEKLILMTDVPGILTDRHDHSTLVRQADIKGVRGLVDGGVVTGGMIPKVECCVRSLAQGVRAAHIIDGRLSHSLLLEILTDEGSGTMITG
ncbi:hypothetical protein SELMODRAFT_83206 [Selaginella moellendorffii]|uniref:acetylglutamate kinase n=1 Tax=Selaginella moellendorffii TaxID=88036 RepID=D8R1S0_SELML|nr:hypothetical protein SELMODRAFT_83206 [Selaginella moellendorffii]